MTEAVAVVTGAGVGSVSLLEAFWLLVVAVCLRDTLSLWWDARRQVQVAKLPPTSEVERILAVLDQRLSLHAVLVQACFLVLGAIGAVRPPQPPPASSEEALVSVASIVLLVTVQLSNVVTAHDRRRSLGRVDRAIQANHQAQTPSPQVPGRRRWDDPKE